MDQENQSQMHHCQRCGRKMKANEKHSCGMSKEKTGAKGEHADRSTQDQIRVRAHELYEARGRQDGHAADDWAEAEKEVLGEPREKKGC